MALLDGGKKGSIVRRMVSKIASDKGAALTEAVLVIPLAFLCAAAVFSIGRALDAAYNTNRIAYETVSILGFTTLSAGTDTGTGHPKAHYRADLLLDLQPKSIEGAPTISTTYVPAAVATATPPQIAAAKVEKEPVSDDKTKPQDKEPTKPDDPADDGPPPFTKPHVIATVQSRMLRLFRGFDITIRARYVGPYFLSSTQLNQGPEFANPSVLVNCSGTAGGASPTACGY